MKKLLIIYLFIFQATVAQIPCSDGFADEYPCSNYDLMSQIPVTTLANTNGTPEGSDIWGWTDTTSGKEYAIAAMTNSTAFVDITDPINPIFLGRLDSNAGNNYWRDVKVYNNHAFIVADNVGAHGMQVFDLTKLRGLTTEQVFTSDAIYNTDNLGSCHNIFINEESGIAYLVGCKNDLGSSMHSGGPIFVDLSDPKNPVKLNHYSEAGYSHDAQVVKYIGPDTTYTDKEIYVGSNETKITILDVTDKNNVILIAEIDYSQLGYTHQGWFTEDHRYFIVGDELDERDIGVNTRTLVFDFSDLDNPVLSSTYFGPSSAIDHNGFVKGNRYFMANYRAGLRVLDITNISDSTNSMTEVGYFDTYPENDNTATSGAWGVYPFFASGNIIINDIEKGLFVVRKSGTLKLNENKMEHRFSIFPNPAINTTTISTDNNFQLQNIKIFSILGQKIFEKNNLSEVKYVLNTSQMKTGIYLIKINDQFIQKMIIQ